MTESGVVAVVDAADLVINLNADPASVPIARRRIRGLLAGRIPDEALDDALLVTSELATLALGQGATWYTVRAWLRHRRFRIEVHDASATAPGAELSGAGYALTMAIVASRAADIGHERDARGVLRWAELRW